MLRRYLRLFDPEKTLYARGAFTLLSFSFLPFDEVPWQGIGVAERTMKMLYSQRMVSHEPAGDAVMTSESYAAQRTSSARIPGRGLQLYGPTFEEFVRAGYPAEKYPPEGYAEIASPGLTQYRATGEVAEENDFMVDQRSKPSPEVTDTQPGAPVERAVNDTDATESNDTSLPSPEVRRPTPEPTGEAGVNEDVSADILATDEYTVSPTVVEKIGEQADEIATAPAPVDQGHSMDGDTSVDENRTVKMTGSKSKSKTTRKV